jgi:carboxypeptidase Taq
MDTRTASTKPAYAELARLQVRLHRLGHLGSIVGWDRSTDDAPQGQRGARGGGSRARRAGPSPADRSAAGEWIRAAQSEPLDDFERANLREIRRKWREANALPESLVEAKTMAAARCEHAWRTQRFANDWRGFLENVREVVKLSREEAQFLSDDSGLSRYDALIDRFEPGMRTADLDRIFGDLKEWLPGPDRARAGEAARRGR